MQSSTEALKAQLQGLLSNDSDSDFLQGAIGARTSLLDILKQVVNTYKDVSTVSKFFGDKDNGLFKNLDLFYN